MPSLDRPRIEYQTPVDLVAEVKRGGLRIPPFQRGFKWQSSDVIALFDSILRGFPVGNLLFWRRPAPAALVRVGPLAIDAPEVDSASWVVDGQQRVTSLVGSLAAAEESADPRFRIYLDLDLSQFHSLGARQQAPPHWIPVSRLAGTATLLSWMRDNADWMTEGHVRLADDAAQAIREYQIPTYVVRSDNEDTLRQIFDRLNGTGKPLSKAEVFHALHSGLAGDRPFDLKTIAAISAELGFGGFDERLALRCVLAYRGGDIFRENFSDEFTSADDRADTYREVAACLRAVVEFLRRDAGIPHSKLLPYTHVVPVLVRFVRLHGEPTGRAAQLLRRWIWRDAVAGAAARGVSVAAVRQAVAAVEQPEPYRAARKLLETAPSNSRFVPDLDKVHLNHAAAKLNLLGLVSVGPRDLVTGRPLDLSAVFDRKNVIGEIILDRDVPLAETFANRLVKTSKSRSVRSQLTTAPADFTLSHLVDERGREFLSAGELHRFLSHRADLLREVVRTHVDSMAEWGARDGQSLANMMRAVA
ncbi:MAG TPA: DUF262 domain-containing protein [Micromonosporaceae bacterium]|nr:DUF262 domain-containing protein [Micromonosporaceae bacterium]